MVWPLKNDEFIMEQFSEQCVVLNRLFDFRLDITAQYNIEFQFTILKCWSLN